jgi:hypothetical protein
MPEQIDRKKWDAAKDKRGLECRRCGCRDLRVVYTRERIGGLRRKRRCRNCGKEMWTLEGQPAS